jgi:hypothetical protein
MWADSLDGRERWGVSARCQMIRSCMTHIKGFELPIDGLTKPLLSCEN